MASSPSPPPSPDASRPIYLIKRKKAGHAGHHGGAWKVAYADFVTAMMALFIVLWLMSAEEKVEQALKAMPNFRDMKEHIEMTVTADGLRIELLETEAGMFFESGRPMPTASGAELLARLAEELGKLPNELLIEGHTDAKPFVTAGGAYSNWELSTDRANAARRLMEGHGVRANQVAQVRGFAERQLRHPQDPESPSNRRISVIVQYLDRPAGSAKAPTEAGKAPAGSAKAPTAAVKAPAGSGKALAEAGKAPAK